MRSAVAHWPGSIAGRLESPAVRGNGRSHRTSELQRTGLAGGKPEHGRASNPTPSSSHRRNGVRPRNSAVAPSCWAVPAPYTRAEEYRIETAVVRAATRQCFGASQVKCAPVSRDREATVPRLGVAERASRGRSPGPRRYAVHRHHTRGTPRGVRDAPRQGGIPLARWDGWEE